MKLWIDDVRPAPDDYVWIKSVNKAKSAIMKIENENKRIDTDTWGVKFDKIEIEVIDIDHDAGDYIELLKWLEATNRNYPIRIHSMNPVGVANMRRVIQKTVGLK